MSTQMDKLLAQQIKAQQKLHKAEMDERRSKSRLPIFNVTSAPIGFVHVEHIWKNCWSNLNCSRTRMCLLSWITL